MKASSIQMLLSFTLLLVGLVMLAEAVIVMIVLQQLTPFLAQSAATVSWGYIILKILAGAIAVISGAISVIKLR